MTGHEIRQRFLDFFAERGHRVVRSSSLVPANDPTLLFTNAGHEPVQRRLPGDREARLLARHQLAKMRPRGRQAQRPRKRRLHPPPSHVLRDAGQLLLRRLLQSRSDRLCLGPDHAGSTGSPRTSLYVTVFREDDEAEELWQKVAGVPKSRIFRLDEKDNFWQMGETGPCGPCSEIHYDLGVGSRRAGPRTRAVSRAMPAAASSKSGTWSSCSTTATRRAS